MEQQVIYHYTTYEYYQSIIKDGYIRTSYKEKKWKIKPAGVWLSLNPICEKTCLRTQLELSTGNKKQMDMYEQSENLGLVRFVLPFKKSELCSFAAYKYKTNIPIEEYLMLEYNGLEVGSNPKEWYIKFKDIPISEVLNIQIFFADKGWIDLTDDLDIPDYDKIVPVFSNRNGIFDMEKIYNHLNNN